MNDQVTMENLKNTLLMEWYGIRIEDVKDDGSAVHHYISVPESSTIEVEDKELNEKIKTSDGLISIAQDLLIMMVIKHCDATYGDEEFTQEVKDNISDYLKVYARIREGEVWTRELGNARFEELAAELKKDSEYHEV